MRELSVDQAKSFLEHLAAGNKAFYGSDRGRGALRDLQQTFPHSWIYVAELLQNAIDAEATCIHFQEPRPGVLLLEHNGKTFDEDDVEGICTKGVSSKGAGTVGFMGVGFKAVFRSYETVTISSGPWKFCLNAKVTRGTEYGDLQRDWIGAVLPEWDNSVPTPSEGMTCRFELQNRLEGLKQLDSDFEIVFREDNSLMALLATKDIQKVKLFATTWLLSMEEHEQEGLAARCVIQAIDDETEQIQQWMLFRLEYEPSREAIRRFLEHRAINPAPNDKERVYNEAARTRRVEIFFTLNDEGFPALPENGEAFALLPTMQKLPFGIHVNADWLLTVTRREFMEVENPDQIDLNEWQKEIRSKIPNLIKAYLTWLGSDEGPSKGSWDVAYRIFPDPTVQQDQFAQWLLGFDFSKHLGELIKGMPFLPGLSDQDGTFSMLSPGEARILPSPLATAFEGEPELYPKKLFGDKIVSRTTLGERAKIFLSKQGILRKLSSNELESYWETTKVSEWHAGLPTEKQNENLYTLIVALSEIEDDSWSNENLVCLPTQADEWVSQSLGIRLPGEWNILVNEERIPDMLLPFVGESCRIIRRRFENYVRNQHYSRWIPDFPVEQSSLDEVVNSWWQSIPEKNLNSLQIEDIVNFTCWVQEKQTSRRSLVKKLLSDFPDGTLALLDVEDTLLTYPYAGDFRRSFFTEIPPVTARYYQNASKDVDWKEFFEGVPPRPEGKFQLDPGARSVDKEDVGQILGQPPPETRVTPFLQIWNGDRRVEVYNEEYVLVEFSLRDDVVEELSRDGKISYLTAFSQWLSENSGPLREFTHQRLLYIPYGSSSVSEIRLDLPAHWVGQLREHCWVMGKDDSGPHKPSDVLKQTDPSRPTAPVADLSSELIRILEQAGVLFETELAEAEAVRRLQFEGPLSSIDALYDLLERAVSDSSGDENKKVELVKVLERTALLPVPPGVNLIDGTRRVPGSRCVLRAGPGYRSDLSWVAPVETFVEESIESKIIDLARQLYDIQSRVSATQCMDFLEWVWEKKPEADSVRQILPRAYSYIAEDIRMDSGAKERWEVIRTNARVYTLGRKWTSIRSSEPVFYDDVGASVLSDLVSRRQLATPGHLGLRVDDGQFPEGVKLLQLPLLSSRFRIDRIEGIQETVPANWKKRFAEVQQFLQEWTVREEVDIENMNDKTSTRLSNYLELRVVSEIAKVVVDVDTRKEIKGYPSWCELSENLATVSGAPGDFAAALCIILLDFFFINKEDSAILATEVAVLLALLNSTEFDDHLDNVLARFGFKPKLGDNEDGTIDRTDDTENESKKEGKKHNDRQAGDAKGRETGGSEPEGSDSGEEEGQEDMESPSYTGGLGENKPEKRGRGGTGSHTAIDRERMISGLKKRLAELKAIGIENITADESDRAKAPTDERFRKAVVVYETSNGRYPESKDPLQKGFDIDSFSSPSNTPGRQLSRRIEVKGRTHPWEGDETIELSRAQFEEALKSPMDEGIELAPDFDHWVYIVEELGKDQFRVLPTRNPARCSRKFELRGGTWRHFVEEGAEVFGKRVELESSDISPHRHSILDLPDEKPDSEWGGEDQQR